MRSKHGATDKFISFVVESEGKNTGLLWTRVLLSHSPKQSNGESVAHGFVEPMLSV
jgi:hypothetical protein